MTHDTDEKALRFAQTIYKNPSILAVGVNRRYHRIYPGNQYPTSKALVLSAAACAIAVEASQSLGLTEVDVRLHDLKALTITRSDVTVAVVVKTGDPVSKSLRRMVRRALKKIYGEERVSVTSSPNTAEKGEQPNGHQTGMLHPVQSNDA